MIYFLQMPGCGRSRRIKRWIKDSQMKYETVPLMDLMLVDAFLDWLCDHPKALEALCDTSLLPSGFSSSPKERKRQMLAESPSAFYRPGVLLSAKKGDKNIENEKLLKEYLVRDASIPCPESCKIQAVCGALRPNNKAGILICHDKDLQGILERAKERAFSLD